MKGLSLPVVDSNPSGFVIYEGKSELDGKPIVVIATGFGRASKNSKTGEMLQCWIMVADTQPVEANNEGLDSSICGSCKHKTFRSCYVNIGNGPINVYRAWKNGKYPVVPQSALQHLFRGRSVRLGSYGDPCSVPIGVWKGVTKHAAMFTSYTHQWKTCDIAYRQVCMASADTLEEAQEAMKRGWKPFLVRQLGEALPAGFFRCPASAEAGKKMTCERCGVCKGGKYQKGKGMPSLLAHGPSWKRKFFHEGMKLLKNHKKIVGVFTKV